MLMMHFRKTSMVSEIVGSFSISVMYAHIMCKYRFLTFRQRIINILKGNLLENILRFSHPSCKLFFSIISVSFIGRMLILQLVTKDRMVLSAVKHVDPFETQTSVPVSMLHAYLVALLVLRGGGVKHVSILSSKQLLCSL